MATIRCPNCGASLGSRNTEDTGYRLRLSITMIDDNGDVRGGCRSCKNDVIVAQSDGLAKALRPSDNQERDPVLVIRVARRT